MEAAWPSEMIVSYYIIIWCHNPHDDDSDLHCHENLKSQLFREAFPSV